MSIVLFIIFCFVLFVCLLLLFLFVFFFSFLLSVRRNALCVVLCLKCPCGMLLTLVSA